jgi:inositol phosphorylceramide mannosyltransferase catalytic subunit
MQHRETAQPSIAGTTIAGGELIPRVIIQTGPADPPLLWQAAMLNVRLLHPTFEYLFFDNAKVEAFIAEQFPEHRKAFHSFRFPIQKYDFFRYLAIYRYGGFYLDMDLFLVHDLEPLLTSSCVFSFEELTAISYLWKRFGMDWQIGNYAFGSVPGHPFLAALVENCIRAKEDPSWATAMVKWMPSTVRDPFYVLTTTGPGLVSRTFAENPHLTQDVTILFPDDVCELRTWHQFGSFGVHQMAGSWRGHQSFMAFRLTRLWENWTLRRILARSKSRGKTRAQRLHQG